MEQLQKIKFDGLLVIRAYDKKGLPVKIRPLPDRSGKTYTGQGEHGYYEMLSVDEKNKMTRIITPETTVVLTDAKTLDSRSPTDVEDAQWVLRHPYVAKDFAAGKSSRDAIFYIEDRKQEAEKRVTASKQKDKARYIIQYNLSLVELRHLAKAVGNLSADGLTELEVQDWLLNLAEVAPDAILFHTNKDNAAETDVTILFNELERWRIIQKFGGGILRFGGEKGMMVGRNAEQAIEFLSKPENKDTVAAITAELNARKTSA